MEFSNCAAVEAFSSYCSPLKGTEACDQVTIPSDFVLSQFEGYRWNNNDETHATGYTLTGTSNGITGTSYTLGQTNLNDNNIQSNGK